MFCSDTIHHISSLPQQLLLLFHILHAVVIDLSLFCGLWHHTEALGRLPSPKYDDVNATHAQKTATPAVGSREQRCEDHSDKLAVHHCTSSGAAAQQQRTAKTGTQCNSAYSHKKTSHIATCYSSTKHSRCANVQHAASAEKRVGVRDEAPRPSCVV